MRFKIIRDSSSCPEFLEKFWAGGTVTNYCHELFELFLKLPIVCLGHLLAMKILSQNEWDRVRDDADIVALLTKADDNDLNITRQAIKLITERGFNRGKDLTAVFNAFSKKKIAG